MLVVLLLIVQYLARSRATTQSANNKWVVHENALPQELVDCTLPGILCCTGLSLMSPA